MQLKSLNQQCLQIKCIINNTRLNVFRRQIKGQFDLFSNTDTHRLLVCDYSDDKVKVHMGADASYKQLVSVSALGRHQPTDQSNRRGEGEA